MKKITITIGLVVAMLSTKAQDTTCTMFHKKEVLEFNYYTDEIIGKDLHTSKYYDINVNYGNVLCLHFYDQKSRIRKVITTFLDGSTNTQVLDSKDNIYYSPQGVTKVSVGRARFLIPCN
tara:strand:+ start:80 stop:439 length:360 start_codon:yes stop_codon:yes gene_type:complete